MFVFNYLKSPIGDCFSHLGGSNKAYIFLSVWLSNETSTFASNFHFMTRSLCFIELFEPLAIFGVRKPWIWFVSVTCSLRNVDINPFSPLSLILSKTRFAFPRWVLCRLAPTWRMFLLFFISGAPSRKACCAFSRAFSSLRANNDFKRNFRISCFWSVMACYIPHTWFGKMPLSRNLFSEIDPFVLVWSVR